MLRFVAMGDGGTGLTAQYAVAQAVQEVCAARGCDFALYLGDNIYEYGVSSTDDPQFHDKFEAPYAELDFPFYVVLGNHDYYPGMDEQSDYQVAYTQKSEKWIMPSHYFSFRKGPVLFLGLDTSAILESRKRPMAEQRDWAMAELAASDAPWAIAFGHHPFVSNGPHGNAGRYDGYDQFPGATAAQTGEPLASLTTEALCGKVQLYLSGHDHHREWLEPTCGTHFLVSGAAAKLRPLAYRDLQPSRWADDTEHGFLWVEIDGDRLHGVFYDADGEQSYEDWIERDR